MTDGLVLEQPSCHKQHVSIQNVGNKCVSMLDMSQRKMVIPEMWKMRKEHHASLLVFSRKPCSQLQHRKQEPTPEHSHPAELREAEGAGIRRAENQRERTTRKKVLEISIEVPSKLGWNSMRPEQNDRCEKNEQGLEPAQAEKGLIWSRHSGKAH